MNMLGISVLVQLRTKSPGKKLMFKRCWKSVQNVPKATVNIWSFANMWFVAVLLDRIAQVFLMMQKDQKRIIRFIHQPVICLKRRCRGLTSSQPRSTDGKRMIGQQGRQPGTGTEAGIAFALSVFAQFSAGQILVCVLGGRSPLLGFDPTPCPQGLTGKKTKERQKRRQ